MEKLFRKNIPNISDAGPNLHKLRDEIISRWEKAVRNDIPAAQKHDPRILRNSLPDFLDILAEALAGNVKQEELAHLSKVHARERANLPEYSIKQVLLEYHHLRKTIIETLTTSEDDRVHVHDYIDRAIAEAGEEFLSRCLKKEKADRKNTDRANHELRAEQSLRQRFLLALSHDLRAPLSTARSAAEALAQNLSAEEHETCRAMIVRNLDRVNQMIEDFLDTNQIQSGTGVMLDVSRFDICQIVSEVIENMAAVHGPRFFAEGKAIEGYWDVRYIRRVIENLLSNAIKYGRKDTAIRIKVEDHGSTVQLSVHNEGEPISIEEQSSIFDQFHRSRSSEGKENGWGIGLALVRGAIQAHGGKVEVQSPVNGGTEFLVILPKDARLVQSPG
jgi:signal transduction histidine kinase